MTIIRGKLTKLRIRRNGRQFTVRNKNEEKDFFTDDPVALYALDGCTEGSSNIGVEYNERTNEVKSVWEEDYYG